MTELEIIEFHDWSVLAHMISKFKMYNNNNPNYNPIIQIIAQTSVVIETWNHVSEENTC